MQNFTSEYRDLKRNSYRPHDMRFILWIRRSNGKSQLSFLPSDQRRFESLKFNMHEVHRTIYNVHGILWKFESSASRGVYFSSSARGFGKCSECLPISHPKLDMKMVGNECALFGTLRIHRLDSTLGHFGNRFVSKYRKRFEICVFKLPADYQTAVAVQREDIEDFGSAFPLLTATRCVHRLYCRLPCPQDQRISCESKSLPSTKLVL